MATRAAIAEALSTVDGVTGYAYRPPTPRAGDGWPLLVGYERVDGRRSFIATQQVRVLLPAGEVAASEWLDEHVTPIFEALSEVAFVESLVPGEIPVAGGSQYILIIMLRGE